MRKYQGSCTVLAMGRQDTPQGPLDSADLAKISEVVKRARSSGQDITEYLNRYALLATTAWTNRVRADAIKDIIEALEHIPAAALVGPRFHTGSWTANDVIDGMLRRLAEIEATARRGNWIA